MARTLEAARDLARADGYQGLLGVGVLALYGWEPAADDLLAVRSLALGAPAIGVDRYLAEVAALLEEARAVSVPAEIVQGIMRVAALVLPVL